MLPICRILLAGLPLALAPALVAHGTSGQGGDSGAWFWAGGALLLTLLLHRTLARHAARLQQKLAQAALSRAIRMHVERVVDDVIVPGAYGGLARIDHALLTPRGLICVRRVAASGMIFGDADAAQWTAVRGASRRRFLNPLIQNEGRRRALEKALPGVPVTSLVVFTGDARFSTTPPANCIRRPDFDTWMRQFSLGETLVTDLDRAWQQLQSIAGSDEATRADFAAQVGFG